MWQRLLDPDICAFIKHHEHDDVAALALKKPPSKDWPYSLILDQIKARQKAAKKIPDWLSAHPDIVLPPADTIEQASSEATARYKASILKAGSFTDLTGGGGIDSWAAAQFAQKGTIIDTDENTTARLKHNLKLLSQMPIDVHHTAAEDFVQIMPETDLVLLDPQRRNKNKRGLYKLEDCSPNIFELLETLKNKTKYLMLKTSPVLDIHKTIEDLPQTREVHIIEWQGECKEVLYLLDFTKETTAPQIHAVQINDNGEPLKTFRFTQKEESTATIDYSAPLTWLFEPSPAFMKSGGYKSLAHHYNLKKIAEHTHLYTSDTPCPDFPGRTFQIIQTLPAQKKALQSALPNLKANLTIRNFPMPIESLKKKLGIKDGGEDYLFACTLQNGEKTLIHTKKP